MNEKNRERRAWVRDDNRRGTISPVMAVVGLVVVVAVVGAVGYVSLSEFGGGGSSNTLKSCYPSGSPECAGQGGQNGSADIVLPLFHAS